MPPKAPQPAKAEPCVHRKNVIGFRLACEELWDAATYAKTVASLPDEVQRATAGLLPMGTWVPERYIVAWAEAVWSGPARRDEALMRRYVSVSIGHGYGRVRRFFLQMMTPTAVAARAAQLWREEHDTGSLVSEPRGSAGARLALTGHVYVATPLTRLAVAEAIRYIVSLTRARRVTETHAARGEALVIDLRWEDDAPIQ